MSPDIERARAEFDAQNYVESRQLLEPLAHNGNIDAQCMLANIYQLGLGIEADGAQAVRWYKRAADRGSALACNNLWCIYTSGCAGVPADEREARRWYDEAKLRGFAHLPVEFY